MVGTPLGGGWGLASFTSLSFPPKLPASLGEAPAAFLCALERLCPPGAGRASLPGLLARSGFPGG